MSKKALPENIKLHSRIMDLEKELERLKKSDEILRRAEIAAGTGSWELHLDSGIMQGSDGAKLIYGLGSNIIEYKTVREIPIPEHRAMMDQALLDLINHGKPYDITFKIKNAFTGKILDIHSICEYDSEKRILFGTVRDITGEKKEEDEKNRDKFDMSVLLRITIELLETSRKRKVLDKIIEGALSIIGLDTGAVYLVDGEKLTLETSLPPVPDDFPDAFRKSLLANHPHIKECVTTRNPVLISDIEGVHLSGEEAVVISNRNMQSLLYIPLLVMNKVRGVLILGAIGRKYDFSRREIDLCRTLSNIGSLSLENSMLFEQLQGSIDELKSTIVKKERTESKLKLLNRVVQHSPVSIVVTDHDGNIEYINPKFTELTGFSWTEAIGKTPGILKSGYQSAEFYSEMWQTISSGKNWYGEMKNRKKNGEFYWEKVLISPITDENDRITHFVGVKEDITEKKAMMENLIRAKEKAEESDRLKTAFLHNISHEIRTPLNAIVGFSSFLGDLGLSPEKRKAYNDIIMSSNDQLLSVIDSIMKISYLETGQVTADRSETEVLRLAGSLFSQFEERAKNKDISFVFDSGNITSGTRIITDSAKLKQILFNLLDNAFKFTEKGHVILRSNMRDGQMEFVVEDTGIGIPGDEHERIFESFYQAGTSSTKVYGGAGIGLSICAGYTEILGGQRTQLPVLMIHT
jgi:PAS domain S-box-containing protein